MEWIEAIESYQQFDHSSPYFQVCELHFKPSDFTIQRNKRALKTDIVPSIFPVENESSISITTTKKR